MNVVFLDIDGVLNNSATNAITPFGFIGIGSNLLKRLAHLTKETSSVVVLSSTWKDEWSLNPLKRTLDGEYLDKKLRQAGITIIDKIDENSTGASNRGAAIKLYLDSHSDIENYVILDDLEFDFKNYPEVYSHFVQTDASLGLTKEKVKEALIILQANNKQFRI